MGHQGTDLYIGFITVDLNRNRKCRLPHYIYTKSWHSQQLIILVDIAETETENACEPVAYHILESLVFDEGYTKYSDFTRFSTCV